VMCLGPVFMSLLEVAFSETKLPSGTNNSRTLGCSAVDTYS
jgi:hypothetical protein